MSLQPRDLTDRGNRGALALGVGLGVIAVAVSLIGRAGGNWAIIGDHLVFHGWVLLWIMVAGAFGRSFGVLEIARFWLFGYFLVAFVVLAIGEAGEAALGDDRELQVALVVPVLEETAKLLPLVVFFAVLRRRLTLPTLTDVVLGAFAIGAGFAFREDVVRERIAADGFDGSFWGVALPSALYEDPRLVVAHGGWTVVAAIGIGLVVLYRRWWSWAVAGVGWLLAVTDHAAVNSIGDLSDELDAITLDGDLLGGAFVLAVGGAIVHDAVVARRLARLDDRFAGWDRNASHTVASLVHALARRRLLTGARLHAWRDLRRGRARDRTELLARLDR